MASQQKKPRLSLKITTSMGPSSGATRRLPVDPKDPTALNTLSNVYLTAIERATPAHREPLTAINTLQAFSLVTPVEGPDPKHRVSTPHVAQYPETPLTAHAMSPRPMDIRYPSTMTATPPMSGTTDSNESKVFTFSSIDTASQIPSLSIQTPATDVRYPQRRQALTYVSAGQSLNPPYTPSQARHSILRNSPLPPRTAIPPSPRRQSQRLQEKAARRVGYNSPIEQEIITNKYTHSHVDLLAEDTSPMSPHPTSAVPSDDALDAAIGFTPNELQDGGQTPGPFEEMRRRMAGRGAASPASPRGIRKRKKKEKKRLWVWTIGQEEEDEEVGGAVAAMRAEAVRVKAKAKPVDIDATTPMGPIPQITYEETPTPSIESADSWSDYRDPDPDVDMTDCSSVYSEDRGSSLHPQDYDMEMKTPTEPKRLRGESLTKRDTPIPEGGLRRDTPIPHPNRDTPIPHLNRDTPIPRLNRDTPIPNPDRDTPIPPEF